MSENEFEFRDNKDLHRLELNTGGYTAFIDYRLAADTLMLVHTEVPSQLGGRGVGGKLAESAFMYAQQNGWKIKPMCSFVATYLEKHPEWEHLVSASKTND